MNSSTRLATARGLGITKWQMIQITRTNMLITTLIVAVLISAFSVIYTKDLHRRLFIQYQNLQQQQQHQMIERGKLLLEQSTWSRQSRIQRIAEQHLHMIVPTAKNMVLVEVRQKGK